MRLLQALGGCVGMVASNAIISDVYPVDKRAKAFSYIMLVMGVAPLIAPTVGSLFIEKADWYYIFFFLAVFAGLVSAMIYFLLPETSLYMHSNKLRIRKIAGDYFEIFKNRSFLMYTLAGSIAMSILFAYISSASFVFLTLYKLDKGTFSILFAINASGLITGSYLNGVLNKYVNYIKIANLAALILSLISVIVLILINIYPQMPYQGLVVGLFLILFCTGFINPNATAASLAPFTNNAGAASALGGSIRMGVGAIVAATIGIFQGNSANTMFITMCGLAISATVFLHIAKRVVRK